MKEKLREFQNMRATDPNYKHKLKEIWVPLTDHMKEEEQRDLPELEKALKDGESASLSEKFELTKDFVPTRSHPSAGEHPPFETVIALLNAPIDKISDAFRKFPLEKRRAGF